MRKKVAGLLILSGLAVMLAGCGGKAGSGGTAQSKAAEADSGKMEANETTQREAAEADPEEKDVEGDPERRSAQMDSGETEAIGTTQKEAEKMNLEKKSEKGKLLYMGHASIRITTPEGKIIYIDPYAGEGYEPAADLILQTHGHYDHCDLDRIANRNADCRIITWKEALSDGAHQTFDLGFATVEAVEAGNNKFHSLDECVGFIVTLTDGTSVYVSGDTSKTARMASLAEKKIDYAFFCCDGVYNMDIDEAAQCASLVGARHNIPYHMLPADGAAVFDMARAEQFDAPDRLIIEDGQEIELE